MHLGMQWLVAVAIELVSQFLCLTPSVVRKFTGPNPPTVQRQAFEDGGDPINLGSSNPA